MFVGSTSWGVLLWFTVLVIGYWAWSIKYKKTNGRKEKPWWRGIYISFAALIFLQTFMSANSIMCISMNRIGSL